MFTWLAKKHIDMKRLWLALIRPTTRQMHQLHLWQKQVREDE